MKNCLKSMVLLIKEFPLQIVLRIYYIVSGVVKSLIPIYAINYIVSSYESNQANVNEVIIHVIIVFSILLVLLLIDFLLSCYQGYVDRNFNARIALRFYDQISKIDYDFYENPDFLNDYMRSLERGASNISQCANNSFRLIVLIFQSSSVLAILLSIHYAVIIYVLIIGIVYFLIRMIMSKLSNKYYSSIQQYNRRTWYSNRAFTLKDSNADIKTTDIDKLLLENNDNSYSKIISYHDKIISKRSILAIICEVMVSLLYPGIIAILCLVTIKDLQLSSFASLTVAATTLASYISQFASILGMLQDNNVECKVAFNFFKNVGKIEGEDNNQFTEDFNNLKINNISFSYDENYKAINDISMEINKGEKIAKDTIETP